MIRLNELCDIEDLRKKCDRSKTRIFGFILYTEENPYVRKVLRDEDFWSALDRKSGPNWPIFSACPNDPFDEYTQTELYNYFDINPKDVPCFVVFIWDDHNNIKRFSVKFDDDSVDAVYMSLQRIIDVITRTERFILDEYKWSENVYREVVNNLDSYWVNPIKDFRDTFRVIEFARTIIETIFH